MHAPARPLSFLDTLFTLFLSLGRRFLKTPCSSKRGQSQRHQSDEEGSPGAGGPGHTTNRGYTSTSVQRGRRRGVLSMGRAPCCDRATVKRGTWSPEEDDKLRDYIRRHGTGGSWITFPKKAGLRRCGKSCRLRWLNYLRPDIRHGGFTDEEDALIFSLYSKLGSKWSLIASQLERRTDNDVKNHWNTKLKKRLAAASTFSSPSSSFLPAPPPMVVPAHPLALAVPTVKAERYTYDDFMAPPAALHVDPFGHADQPGSTSASAASSASNWSAAAADNAGADGFFADFCTGAADQFLGGFYYPLDPTLSLV